MINKIFEYAVLAMEGIYEEFHLMMDTACSKLIMWNFVKTKEEALEAMIFAIMVTLVLYSFSKFDNLQWRRHVKKLVSEIEKRNTEAEIEEKKENLLKIK